MKVHCTRTKMAGFPADNPQFAYEALIPVEELSAEQLAICWHYVDHNGARFVFPIEAYLPENLDSLPVCTKERSAAFHRAEARGDAIADRALRIAFPELGAAPISPLWQSAQPETMTSAAVTVDA